MEKILNLGRKLIPKKIFRLAQPVYHLLLAVSGNIYYRFPGRKLICIGVTGTNGKSTTVELVNSVLKEAGFITGMISTISFEIAGSKSDNTTSRTTLGRWQTPRMLRKMVKAGCKYAIIEVASEGIAWRRIWGIPFDVAVFTNLSPEHLNFHKNMRNYRNTKGKLFANLSLSKKKKGVSKISVVNADDKEAGYFGSFPADVHYLYGTKRGDIRAIKVSANPNLKMVIMSGGKKYPIDSRLWGGFNAYNLLAAWCVGLSQKIKPEIISKGLEAVKLVEGRMQDIPNNRDIRVIVDYAMTPDSYEMLFDETRKITTGKLITVFGAAGDRDRSKRPIIGEVAGKLADYVILTDDEPYSENPKKIIEEIELGLKKVKDSKYEILPDRRMALKNAIGMAQKGDTIVIPGMGHEKFRNIGGNKRIPWDEAKILAEILKK